MTRLISLDEIRDDWYPPSGVLAPEFLPERWTGPHVARRLGEAYRTLFRIPSDLGPRMFGTSWPAYSYEWGDLLSQQEQETDERRRNERIQNRTRIMPSAEDVSRMERALYWPARHLQAANAIQYLRPVQLAAIAFALDRDYGWIAHKHGGHPETWKARNWAGCAIIAEWLTREREPVF